MAAYRERADELIDMSGYRLCRQEAASAFGRHAPAGGDLPALITDPDVLLMDEPFSAWTR